MAPFGTRIQSSAATLKNFRYQVEDLISRLESNFKALSSFQSDTA